MTTISSDIMWMTWFFPKKETRKKRLSVDKKEQVFVRSKTVERIWHQTCPDYKGRVGQAVVDLGITLRTHNEASLNKKKRVHDTVKVVKQIQSLGLSVRDNINSIKAAGQ
eukprot:2128412-Heterocapsa_arctica.AAC.1